MAGAPARLALFYRSSSSSSSLSLSFSLFISLYLAISPSRIASTRLYSGFPEVNKGRREEGEEERMERPPRVTVFKNFQRAT